MKACPAPSEDGCRQKDSTNKIVDVDRGEHSPAAGRQNQAAFLGLLDRNDGPRPRSGTVDIARADDGHLDFAAGIGLEGHRLGGDLGVDVGVPVGSQRPRLLDAVRKPQIAVGPHRTEMHDAPDAGPRRGFQDASGAQDVGLPLLGRRHRIADDGGGVQHDGATG